MLDFDLAAMYGVKTGRLNEQVKRNIERFPEDFMFQLTNGEYEILKSQIVTSNVLISQNATSNTSDNQTRAQLDAISTALSELQSKEPRKRERRPIGFIVPDEKKE